MKAIAIVGFGALGRQIRALLGDQTLRRKLIVFDDVEHGHGRPDSYPFNSYLDDRFASCEFYVGLGYHNLPKKAAILQELRAAGRWVPSFVHPSCHVHPSARIGDGCFVYPCCNVDQDVQLGHGVLLHNSVVISHECGVGDAAYLSPGVVLSGRVTIGPATFVGAGVLVANDRTIGPRSRIGIGTVVTSDMPEGGSAIGNPMRILDQPLRLE